MGITTISIEEITTLEGIDRHTAILRGKEEEVGTHMKAEADFVLTIREERVKRKEDLS
jgi:hypothetical protein